VAAIADVAVPSRDSRVFHEVVDALGERRGHDGLGHLVVDGAGTGEVDLTGQDLVADEALLDQGPQGPLDHHGAVDDPADGDVVAGDRGIRRCNGRHLVFPSTAP
jgi:hypothetical protein